jgi:AcrR family transcriptional regulator
MSSHPNLSRERILVAALAIVDAEGMEALSMRRLARDLSVQAMSLYNHITNREEIIDALVEVVIEEMGAPDLAVPWIEAVRRQALATHEVLVRHPWAAMMIMSRVNVGPARFRLVDRMIGCFVNAGFSLAAADAAANLVDSFTYGYTLQEVTFPLTEGTYREVAEAYIDQIPEERYPYLRRMAGAVMDGSYSGVHDFTFGLDLMLAALAASSPGKLPSRS